MCRGAIAIYAELFDGYGTLILLTTVKHRLVAGSVIGGDKFGQAAARDSCGVSVRGERKPDASGYHCGRAAIAEGTA